MRHAPPIGQTAHCGKHNASVYVMSVVAEYWISCTNCQYKKGYGDAPLTARTYAGSHAAKRQHRVIVYHGRKAVSSHGRDPDQLHLEYDEPPF
jgi:hypothetical protein